MLGAVSLDFSPQAGPTKFMIGTEQGTILACNRKAKNPQDRVGAVYPGNCPCQQSAQCSITCAFLCRVNRCVAAAAHAESALELAKGSWHPRSM